VLVGQLLLVVAALDLLVFLADQVLDQLLQRLIAVEGDDGLGLLVGFLAELDFACHGVPPR
jgi:hypothetical protein